MKKFTVTEAEMLLENGDKLDQVFNYSSVYLDDFVQYILETCSQAKNRDVLSVNGWYDMAGFVLEIFFPLETDSDVQIMFGSDVRVNVDDCTERVFHANEWYEIGYTSAQKKNRNTAGFGSDLYKDKAQFNNNKFNLRTMKKFTISEARMRLENGSELDQVFNCTNAYLEDLVQYVLEICSQAKNRDRLKVRGWYDGVGFILEVFFPLETDADVQITFDKDVRVNVDWSTEQVFSAGKSYEIGYKSAQVKNRNTTGLGSDLYKDKEDKEDKEDVRSYNVGASDYAQHKIQPWDIYLDYNLNPWDADIVKRVLRTKKTDGRKLDYEKIIHICKERIRQIDEYGK